MHNFTHCDEVHSFIVLMRTQIDNFSLRIGKCIWVEKFSSHFHAFHGNSFTLSRNLSDNGFRFITCHPNLDNFDSSWIWEIFHYDFSRTQFSTNFRKRKSFFRKWKILFSNSWKSLKMIWTSRIFSGALDDEMFEFHQIIDKTSK